MTKTRLSRAARSLFVSPRIPIGVFAFFILCTMAITWYAIATSSRQLPPPPTSRIEETVSLPGTDLVVESVRRDASGAGPLTPHPDNEFIVVMVTLVNTSERTFELVPLLSFHIKDAAGNVYNVTAVPSDSNQLSGPLLPHDTIREEIGFEVPKGASGLRMLFEPGTPGHDVALIDLTEVPGFLSLITKHTAQR